MNPRKILPLLLTQNAVNAVMIRRDSGLFKPEHLMSPRPNSLNAKNASIPGVIMTRKKSSGSFRDGLVRLLLGKKYVPLWYFRKYKNSMESLLKRKDRQIRELQLEKSTLLQTLVKQTQKNYQKDKKR